MTDCAPRRLLILAGTPDWLGTRYAELAGSADRRRLWLGGPPPPGWQAIEPSRVRDWLGQECDALGIDLYHGLDVDALAALLGCLRGGGTLLLCGPPLAQWATYDDPSRRRLACHPYSPDAVGGRLPARLATLFGAHAEKLFEQGGAADVLSFPPEPMPVAIAPITPNAGQLAVIAAVLKVARGRSHRPLVLRADRGRGKSSALGLAAAALLQRDGRRIVVTAPRRAAVDALFAHLHAALPGAQLVPDGLVWGDAAVSFVDPDRCGRAPQNADLLLVDEAAGIPAAQLRTLLECYPRVVFATTVHGYEGTGRGFDIRFRATLDRLTPQWRAQDLREPLRWMADDPLERLLFQALVLDAEPAALTDAPGEVTYTRVDQDRLVRDETLLQEVFGLLVAAHYQTRPRDLRQLLDAPDLELLLARQNGRVIGMLAAVHEGGFAADLAGAIWAGKRRPHGHLLAQSLAAHAGLREAAQRRYLRVWRIAVHPGRQRRGIGRALLAALRQLGQEQQMDALATSFGMDAELLEFWRACAFVPVRVGLRRDPASGAHALQMLAPLTAAGEMLAGRAQRRAQEQLPWQLAGGLRDLEPELVAALLLGRRCDDLGSDPLDRSDLEAVAWHRRDPATCILPLWRASCRRLAMSGDVLPVPVRDVLVLGVLQQHPPPEVIARLRLAGHAAFIACLREAAGMLLHVDASVVDASASDTYISAKPAE